MKKLTLANKRYFFSNVKPGDKFEYSFSTMALDEVRQLAKESGLNISYLYGTTCEITEYRNKYNFFAFKPNESNQPVWYAPMRNDKDLLTAFLDHSQRGNLCQVTIIE